MSAVRNCLEQYYLACVPVNRHVEREHVTDADVREYVLADMLRSHASSLVGLGGELVCAIDTPQSVRSFILIVRELAASGAPRLQAKLGLDPGSAAARIRRVAYERIGVAIARGHAQQLLARLGCVDVCRAYRNGAHVGDAVLACEAPTLLIASDRGI